MQKRAKNNFKIPMYLTISKEQNTNTKGKFLVGLLVGCLYGFLGGFPGGFLGDFWCRFLGEFQGGISLKHMNTSENSQLQP